MINASKEECEFAATNFRIIEERLKNLDLMSDLLQTQMNQVKEFLAVAYKKLPKEASFKKGRNRINKEKVDNSSGQAS